MIRSYTQKRYEQRLARAKERAEKEEDIDTASLVRSFRRSHAKRDKAIAKILNRQRAERRPHEVDFAKLTPEERRKFHLHSGRLWDAPKQKKNDALDKAYEIRLALKTFFLNAHTLRLPSKAIAPELYKNWSSYSAVPRPDYAPTTFRRKVALALSVIRPKHKNRRKQ